MPRISTTAGRLAVNSLLPPELRSDTRVLDKAGTRELLKQIAQEHPDKYREISYALGRLGEHMAYLSGGNSFGVRHLKKARIAQALHNQLRQQLAALLDDDSLSDQEREKRIIDATADMQERQTKAIYDESLAEQNPLALQLKGAGRGNQMNLASLRGSDALYVDHRNRVIGVPILRSFSEGLTPAEYFASSFGARKGVVDVKLATADAGYLGKVLNQITHRAVVSGLDSPHEPTSPRGLPSHIDDPDNEGALLAQPTGGYARNTILTPQILASLRDKGIERLLVRSVIADGSPDGGVWARDAGMREYNRLPQTGESIGQTAAQAISEPIAQGSLCLSAGTKVRMADGSQRAIENIRAGDWVMGCSRDGEVRPSQVLEAFDNGIRDCVQAVFRKGSGVVKRENLLKIIATADHNILTEVVLRTGSSNNRPSRLARLYAGRAIDVRTLGFESKGVDYLCARLSSTYDDRDHYHEPFALMFGVLLGDGCYTGNLAQGVIGLSCYDPQQMRGLRSWCKSNGFELRPMTTAGEWRLTDLTHRTMKTDSRGVRYRNRFKNWLERAGCWGHNSNTKTLPQEVFSWTNQAIAELLSGFIAADGHVTRMGKGVSVGFGSNSRVLLEQLKLLLELRFGVLSSSVGWTRKKKTGGGYYRRNYRFSVNRGHDLAVLRELLLIPGVKHRRLSRSQDKSRRRLAPNHVPNHPHRCSLISRKQVGARHTYDIKIDHPDHLFVLANGLIVSNSSKHSGGVRGAGAAKAVSGFKAVEQLLNIPSTFRGGAAHATRDGAVTRIEPAAAGGHFIYVDGEKHYVASGLQPTVKLGDNVEAGDMLSEGTPNPELITRYKGIGEGRRYFVDTFSRTLHDAGFRPHRRNVELLARGLINHVRAIDEVGGAAPDDVVPYSFLEHRYEPREDSKDLPPRASLGRYLERPVLHYSIGTKIRPSVVRELDAFHVPAIHTHHEPPPFEAEMQRGVENASFDPDPLTKLYGSRLQRSLLHDAARGATSDPTGTSFVPGLAKGTGFGETGKLKLSH